MALEERFGRLVELIRAVRNNRQERGMPANARPFVTIGGLGTPLTDAEISTVASSTNSQVSREGATPSVDPSAVVGPYRLWVIAPGVEQQPRDLESELEEARLMVRRSQELLAKPGFVDKAPRGVVEKERARLKEREDRLKLLETEPRKGQDVIE
jgi:valyl-tRNA synthetase